MLSDLISIQTSPCNLLLPSTPTLFNDVTLGKFEATPLFLPTPQFQCVEPLTHRQCPRRPQHSALASAGIEVVIPSSTRAASRSSTPRLCPSMLYPAIGLQGDSLTYIVLRFRFPGTLTCKPKATCNAVIAALSSCRRTGEMAKEVFHEFEETVLVCSYR